MGVPTKQWSNKVNRWEPSIMTKRLVRLQTLFFAAALIKLMLSIWKGEALVVPWKPFLPLSSMTIVAHRSVNDNSGVIVTTLFSKSGDLPDCDENHDDDRHQHLSMMGSFSTSVQFAMDPYSECANAIIDRLEMTPQQHQQLTDLASLVVEWNQRINLVSRRDCTVPVVFGRHVLPSLSIQHVIRKLASTNTRNHLNPASSDSTSGLQKGPSQQLRIIDVGTGGGFPGLPLAIALPHAQVLCVDSVAKKVRTVQAMADALALPNVKTFAGRAEEMTTTVVGQQHPQQQWKHGFDVAVGRSVTALPNFCSWIQDLIEPESGKLLYIIGGTIEDEILAHVQLDLEIDQLLSETGVSDKRILVLDAQAVRYVASLQNHPGTLENNSSVNSPKPRSLHLFNKKHGSTQEQHPLPAQSAQQKKKGRRNTKDDASDNRDYDNFRRYSF